MMCKCNSVEKEDGDVTNTLKSELFFLIFWFAGTFVERSC